MISDARNRGKKVVLEITTFAYNVSKCFSEKNVWIVNIDV